MVPVAVLLSLQTNRAGHSSTDMQRMDTAKPGEPAHLSRKSRVVVKHWISSVCRTMCVICLIPSMLWRQPVHHCSEQNFCQASSVSKTFEHYARLVFAYIVYASESRPELTQRNVQLLISRYSLCKQLCNHTLQKIFALLTQAAFPEPLPNISIKPTVLGEGAPRLQACVNAVELAIIANSIALNTVLKAVCTTRALCSSQ